MVEGEQGFSLAGRKLSKETSTRHHGRESVTKGTVKMGIDFTGKPLVE